MNVCEVCMADGVLQVGGCWYCVRHMHEGLADVAMTIHQLATPHMECEFQDLRDELDEVLANSGYQFPDDE
jgi:hypothetical protein